MELDWIKVKITFISVAGTINHANISNVKS